jgi:transcription antitermination factor NusG
MAWYALYTKPRHEKKVNSSLMDKHYETFLPLISRVRQWKDRKKKVEMPLFSSYLFANFDYKNRFNILETEGIVKIVNFHGIPALVPEWQIDSLRKMLAFPEKLSLERYIKPGEIVEIVDGLMKGMKGMVVKRKNEERLVLSIEGIMQSVSIEIDQVLVKRVLEK